MKNFELQRIEKKNRLILNFFNFPHHCEEVLVMFIACFTTLIKITVIHRSARESMDKAITSSIGEEVFIFREKFDRPVARSSTLAKILKLKENDKNPEV